MERRPKGVGPEAKTRDEKNLPRGMFAASVTPLRGDLSIDALALAGHCEHLFENGCDGVALFGTTGEAASFTREERERALEDVIDAGVPAHRLLVGTGCCAAADTVGLTRHAVHCGVGGVLVLPPFYYKDVSEAGVIESYRRVIGETAETDLRLYLYHFPRMTGVVIGEDVIGRLLSEFPEIIAGVKDSSGDLENLRMLCARFGNLEIYPGSELYLLEGLRTGAAGCISGTTNVTGPLAAAVYRDWREGEHNTEVQTRLSAIRRIFDTYPLIAAVKYVVSCQRGNPAWLHIRPPLCPLSSSEGEGMVRKLVQAGFPGV
jgi:4-hydroxy-tetrahydrodipicolinate synthase